MKLKILIIGVLVSLSQVILSQKNDRFPSYFGFQFKPLIPGDFLAKSVIKTGDNQFSGTFTQKYGYSFGAVTRVGITRLISFETGINQIKRNYQIDFAIPDSNLYGQTTLSIISYDIPLTVMVYIQLSEQFYTNASLGSSLVYYPSNVGSYTAVDNKVVFSAEGRRNRRFDAEINGNLGFELRTAKKGFFYLGTSGKIPFSAIYKVAAVYEFPSDESVAVTGEINGAYLSIDLRYFFPNSKSKVNSYNEGPIRQ